jgi:AbrB family looped-hinge helix DNA binding protein
MKTNVRLLSDVLLFSNSMQKLARVSSKGQLVLPAKLRRKLKIGQTILIREEEGRIILEPAKRMEESFGDGGEKARQAAIEISLDRRKEVEFERKKLSV